MTFSPSMGALVTAAGSVVALLLVRRLVVRWARRLSSRTANALDDQAAELVERCHPATIATVSGWMSARAWLGGEGVPDWLTTALVLAVFAQVGLWAGFLVEAFTRHRRSLAAGAGLAGDATAWTALSLAGRLAVWAIVGLLALDNVGVDVTALVAGLGIGGLAVGLALQNVLGDVFASLAIILDRPFVIGDFLVVDEVMGTVEHIGLKTTRVRALSGEQVVLSNADLLASRIRNYQRLSERRVVLTFGVLYETAPEVLARIPDVVREIVAAQPRTRFDRAHLCRFGESSVDFEVVYFLADVDYNRHMDAQQAILLGVFRRFGELGVGFAYPTRTLHLYRSEGAA